MPGQRVRDFAERGLDGFFVLRHGNLPSDPGAVQIGLVAARVKNGQQQGRRDGEAPGAVLEQAGQLAAGGACLRCQGDAREKRRPRRANVGVGSDELLLRLADVRPAGEQL